MRQYGIVTWPSCWEHPRLERDDRLVVNGDDGDSKTVRVLGCDRSTGKTAVVDWRWWDWFGVLWRRWFNWRRWVF